MDSKNDYIDISYGRCADMVSYILRRLLLLIPILFLASVLVFGMSHLSKTDPALVMVGGKQTSPEVLENIRVKYHLNEPV